MIHQLRRLLSRMIGRPTEASTSDLLRDMKTAGSKAEAQTIMLRNQRRDQRDRGADILIMLTDLDDVGKGDTP